MNTIICVNPLSNPVYQFVSITLLASERLQTIVYKPLLDAQTGNRRDDTGPCDLQIGWRIQDDKQLSN